MIRTPAGSKWRLLCVAKVWPRSKAVAAINESSHVIVRLLFLRSARSSFQRTRIGSVSSSIADGNVRRVWASQSARAARCVAGACCNPNSSSASETALTTRSFWSAIQAASFAGIRLRSNNESRSVSRRTLTLNGNRCRAGAGSGPVQRESCLRNSLPEIPRRLPGLGVRTMLFCPSCNGRTSTMPPCDNPDTSRHHFGSVL